VHGGEDTAGRALEVAVVIPAFNAAATLGDALESVRAQTLTPSEVVVVDDGSVDCTMEIARRHRATVIAIPNGGAAAARNVGVRATRSPWIAFLDADDTWRADKLAKQAVVAASEPFVYSDALIIDGSHEKRVSSNAPCPAGRVLEPLILNNVVTLSTVLARRDVLVEAGLFAESRGVVHDWPLWLKIAARHPFGYVDEPLVRYHVRPDGLSKNLDLLLPELLDVVADAFSPTGVAHHLAHLKPRAMASAYAVVAHEACKAKRWTLALDLCLRRVSLSQTDGDAWKALMKTVLASSGLRRW
jgi:glycosyltransferase involved in cell wall biosynthesis